jgi:hypothetical protein
VLGCAERFVAKDRTEQKSRNYINLVLDHDTVLKNLVRRMGEISHVNMVEAAGVKAVLSPRSYVNWWRPQVMKAILQPCLYKNSKRLQGAKPDLQPRLLIY